MCLFLAAAVIVHIEMVLSYLSIVFIKRLLLLFYIYLLISFRKCSDSTNTMAIFDVGANFAHGIRLETEGGELQWCSIGCNHRNNIIIGEPCIFSLFGNILLFIVACHQVSQSNKTKN